MCSSTESVEVRRPHNPARNLRGTPLNRYLWESTTDSSEELSTSPHPDGAGHDGEQSSPPPGDDGRGRSGRIDCSSTPRHSGRRRRSRRSPPPRDNGDG